LNVHQKKQQFMNFNIDQQKKQNKKKKQFSQKMVLLFFGKEHIEHVQNIS